MARRTYAASPALEAFYQDAMAGFKAAIDKHSASADIRTLEVIAALGRAAGYAIAACYPDERDLARKTLDENVSQAIRDTAQDAPTRPGVKQ